MWMFSKTGRLGCAKGWRKQGLGQKTSGQATHGSAAILLTLRCHNILSWHITTWYRYTGWQQFWNEACGWGWQWGTSREASQIADALLKQKKYERWKRLVPLTITSMRSTDTLSFPSLRGLAGNKLNYGIWGPPSGDWEKLNFKFLPL